ncbi:MAG: hypothetical protein U9R56_04435, partial [candidate division Zixibacteria bacterium]|nr:hypothetical protein [candidate division Zixibacteria bacterium]
MKKKITTLLPVIPALAVYSALAHKFNFIQDDAFISYRYVANYLNGHGLVYNIGERIEGFTNFGWVICTIFWGVLGVEYINVSRITGLLFGAGIIVLTYMMARLLFNDRNRWFALLPTGLVGINLSLAYWSPAGLETAAFAFLAMLSLYLYLKRNWLLIFSILMAVWVRPEGALLVGLLLIIEAVTERRLPKFSFMCAAISFIMSLPFVVFKLVYYGSVFPNPFFAKTGIHFDQIQNGMEYAGRFLSDYGFYGVGFLIPLIFYRKLSREMRVVWLFSILYTIYVILVGGDVLKVHRFFIPILGPAAILLTVSIQLIVRKLKSKTRYMILFVTAIPLLILTYVLPWDYVTGYNYYEKKFTKKMRFMAHQMKLADSTDFSVAIPTIGNFGYELLGHEIIDMVGLTDSTIARHSEKPIEGMETTWKEQKHNSRYLLGRAPDYIVFSTGIKPSAPAERALLLFPQFLNAYRNIGWFYRAHEESQRGSIVSAFKRVRKIEGELEPTYPIEYVQHYKTGLDYYVAGDHARAIKYYSMALKASPKPYNLSVIYQKAFSHMILGQHDKAVPLLEMVLAEDSVFFEAHKDLYFYAIATGDTVKAAIHERWL